MACGERGSGVLVGSALVRVTLKSFSLFLRPLVNNEGLFSEGIVWGELCLGPAP